MQINILMINAVLVPQGGIQKSKRRQYRLSNDLEWLVDLRRVVLEVLNVS